MNYIWQTKIDYSEQSGLTNVSKYTDWVAPNYYLTAGTHQEHVYNTNYIDNTNISDTIYNLSASTWNNLNFNNTSHTLFFSVNPLENTTLKTTTDNLIISGFTFNVPTGSTILGIELRIIRQSTPKHDFSINTAATWSAEDEFYFNNNITTYTYDNIVTISDMSIENGYNNLAEPYTQETVLPVGLSNQNVTWEYYPSASNPTSKFSRPQGVWSIDEESHFYNGEHWTTDDTKKWTPSKLSDLHVILSLNQNIFRSYTSVTFSNINNKENWLTLKYKPTGSTIDQYGKNQFGYVQSKIFSVDVRVKYSVIENYTLIDRDYFNTNYVKDIDNVYFKYQKCLNGICYNYIKNINDIYNVSLLTGDGYCVNNLYNEYNIIDKYMDNFYQIDIATNVNIDLSKSYFQIDNVNIKPNHLILLFNQSSTTENDIYRVNDNYKLINSEILSTEDLSYRAKCYVKLGSNKEKQYFLVNSGSTFPISGQTKSFIEGHSYIIKNIINYNVYNTNTSITYTNGFSGATLTSPCEILFTDYSIARSLIDNRSLYDNKIITLDNTIYNISQLTYDNIHILNKFGSGFNNIVNCMIEQTDGKIIVGGNFTTYNGTTMNSIARLNIDGTLDPTFIVGTGFNFGVSSLALDSYDKIYVGGFFTSYNGITSNYIVKLDLNGTLDPTFIIGDGFNYPVNSLTVDSYDNIYVVGFFTAYSGITSKYIVKLDPNGVIDSTFQSNAGLGFDSRVYCVKATNDLEHIIIGGYFTTYSGITYEKIIRLNLDGTIDFSGAAPGTDGIIFTVELDSSDNIYIGGSFTTYQGQPYGKIAKIKSDGSILNPAPGIGANNIIYSLSLYNDTDLFAGGIFTAYDGIVTNNLIRLNSDCTLNTTYDIITTSTSVKSIITQPTNILIGGSFSYLDYQSINISYLDHTYTIYRNCASGVSCVLSGSSSNINWYNESGYSYFKMDSYFDSISIIGDSIQIMIQNGVTTFTSDLIQDSYLTYYTTITDTGSTFVKVNEIPTYIYNNLNNDTGYTYRITNLQYATSGSNNVCEYINLSPFSQLIDSNSLNDAEIIISPKISDNYKYFDYALLNINSIGFTSTNQYIDYQLQSFMNRLSTLITDIYNLYYVSGDTYIINEYNYFDLYERSSMLIITSASTIIDFSMFRPFTFVEFGDYDGSNWVGSTSITMIYEIGENYMIVEKPSLDLPLCLSGGSYTIRNISSMSKISDLLFDVYTNYNHGYYIKKSDNIRNKICSAYGIIVKEKSSIRNITTGIIYQDNDEFVFDLFNNDINSTFNYTDSNLTYIPIEILDIGVDKKTKLPIPIMTKYNTTTVSQLSLRITYDNISNSPASDLTGWNMIFNLPTNGLEFTDYYVSGNTIILIGGGNIIMNNTFYNDVHIVSFENSGCISAIEDGIYSASCFGNCTSLTTIKLDVATYIGDYTFYNCTGLTSISLPSATYFGIYCFAYCSSLISTPNGLFDNCISMTSFEGMFKGCNGLTGITNNLFDNNTLVTNFSYTFFNCTNLSSIPTGLFDNNISNTTFYRTFFNCAGLTSIPSGLFDNCILVTTFEWTFYNCISLITIPSGLFNNTSLVTSFGYTFYSCSNLASIPTGLFDNNILATYFNSTFSHCAITSIPTGLFDYNTLVTDFSYTFNHCDITSIPTGLFDNCSLVIDFVSTFYGCPITSIPTGLFDNNTLVTDFSATFYNCTNLTSIPTGLFDNCTAVTNFINTFAGCTGLTSITNGLFDCCTLVTNFNSTFYGCTHLTSIPNGLFDNNSSVTNFLLTFSYCQDLTSIPSGLFDNNTLVTDFRYTFNLCSNLTGDTPELWITHSGATGTSCFSGDTGLTDWNYIPSAWGGGGQEHTFNILINIAAPSSTFTLPLVSSGAYNFDINWGDGSSDTITIYNDPNTTHIYDDPDDYIISMIGTCTEFNFNDVITSADKVKQVTDFVDLGFEVLNFGGCVNLTGITNRMGLMSHLTTASGMFANCSLTAIPSGLFDNCALVSNFYGTFGKCSNLLSIPTGLFDNCISANDFSGTFQNSTNLTGDAPNLWITHYDATGTSCFNNDIGLTNWSYIPTAWGGGGLSLLRITYDDLSNAPASDLAGWNSYFDLPAYGTPFTNYSVDGDTAVLIGINDIIMNNITFYNDTHIISFEDTGCITKIEDGDGSYYATNGCFSNCTSLTTIRLDMATYIGNNTFINCNILSSISFPLSVYFGVYCFAFCNGLTSIPSDLFNNCDSINYLDGMFWNCSGLTSIPNNLFDSCVSAVSFKSTFANCINLVTIPSLIFANCTLVNSFNGTFINCTNLSGSAPDLWVTHSSADGTNCFSGDVGLTNYISIPAGWK